MGSAALATGLATILTLAPVTTLGSLEVTGVLLAFLFFFPHARRSYGASRALGWEIDYKRLIEFFQTKAQLVRAFYYAVLPEEGDYSSLRPLLDWLSYNGFSTVTKSKPEFLDAGGRRRLKASIDVELAVDAMRFADNVDHIVLFSGDGDFRRLVAALQEKGKRVSVLSTLHREAPMVADELRRQADQFVELDDLHDQLSRKANPTRLSA